MNSFPYAIVGFDLDGTLIDTSGDLAAAVNVALLEARRPALTVEQVESMIGGGAKHLLQQALAVSGGIEPEEGRRLYKLMLREYEANIAVLSKPFPGAIAAVDELASLGVKVGIVTNKFESLARKLLSELGLIERFATLIGGDTLGRENAKPSPAPIHRLIQELGGGATAFVGDSRYDVLAAKNAGVASVAVSFGFLLEPVSALGADAVIDRFDDLVSTLRSISR